MLPDDSLPLPAGVPALPSGLVLESTGHFRSSWNPATETPDPKALKFMDLRAHLLLAAACDAWARSPTPPDESWGVAAALPDATPAWHAWDEALLNGWPHSPPPRHTLPPLWLLGILPNLPAAHLSMQFGLRGPCQALTGECPGVLVASTGGRQATAWLLRSCAHV